MAKTEKKLIANNKKAYHDYFILEKYEAGLVLHGTEVKSLRMGKCSIKEAFKLITRIQDEAHRFAIEFHRQLRGKGQVHSVLDDIEGIGPARRKALMRHYLSLDAIRSATVEELAQLPSMNEKAAESVYQFFHD